jgi:hypothetical protein
LIEYTLQQFVLRLLAMVFVAAIHGFAVAGTACALGDPGPRYDGRLTANPFTHLDLLGTLAGVFSLGWIRPIAIDPALLRFGASRAAPEMRVHEKRAFEAHHLSELGASPLRSR